MHKPTRAYKHWLQKLKERIRSSQIKAALKVNAEMLSLYWDLGLEILDKEKAVDWGDKWLYNLADDLSGEFPDIKGFSHTNLKYIRRWVNFYSADVPIGQQAVAQLENLSKGRQAAARIVQRPVGQKQKKKLPEVAAAFGQQPVDQIPSVLTTIPWGHHLQIITKCKDIKEALYYISQTTQHNWSRSVLVHQMESGLYKRKGKALSNFEYTLPAAQSDLAKELLKNPYNLGFLSLNEQASEKELEDALITHLIKFLLELGSGFAFIGRQHLVKVRTRNFLSTCFLSLSPPASLYCSGVKDR